MAGDPTLAVYVAYALADSGRRDEIKTVQAEPRLFDIDLLAPDVKPAGAPGFPLLARGWALVDLPALPRPRSSHWTLFDEGSEAHLRHFLERR